ncbi:hypothetical protein NDU88_008579 [Pleurodeles waltl]|uniref:Uncharacterized protein n=1 Tax=Pleurodeles waltl TaxID=8319 RepID=A0AAV7P0P0_PLEWA|nr:hypothetical protein NDU88_008579 [Pleurodeles waltl]
MGGGRQRDTEELEARAQVMQTNYNMFHFSQTDRKRELLPDEVPGRALRAHRHRPPPVLPKVCGAAHSLRPPGSHEVLPVQWDGLPAW